VSLTRRRSRASSFYIPNFNIAARYISIRFGSQILLESMVFRRLGGVRIWRQGFDISVFV
jgi:hypothetical protein